MARQPKKVNRKVYFFRIAHFEDVRSTLESAIEHVASLPFNDQGRYLPTSIDDAVHAVYVERDKYPIRLQLARIRRSDFPLVEDAGNIQSLILNDNAGLMDWSHIVIFDDGYAVAEFNRDAPRIASLGEYLVFKSAGKIRNSIKFLPLLQKAVLEELEKFEHISVLQIEAFVSESEAISKGNEHIGAAFAACAEVGQAKKTEIILKTAYQPELDLMQLVD